MQSCILNFVLILTYYIKLRRILDLMYILGVSEKDIEIKVLTRSKEADEGKRKRIKKHAKNELIKTDGVDVKYHYLLHSRILIIDCSEILISSVDLTQDN